MLQNLFKNKNKILIISSLFLVIIIMFINFNSDMDKKTDNIEELKEPSILKDIDYATNKSFDYRVYIKENDTYVPYLVLTDDYNGNSLLLREKLLDKDSIYNVVDNGTVAPGYYENSTIDLFLNNEFINVFLQNIQKSIVSSKIEITEEESLGIGGDDTKNINRKIFLLSFTELNVGYSRTNLKEGDSLAYFENKERRIAYYEDGTSGSWWLRTPNTSSRTIVCGVTKEGIVGIGGIYDPNIDDGYYNGVRPAFCLPNETKINQITINETTVFAIE